MVTSVKRGKKTSGKSAPKKSKGRKASTKPKPKRSQGIRKSTRVAKSRAVAQSPSHSSGTKNKKGKRSAVSDRNTLLMKLNEDPTGHKEDFNKALQHIVDNEKMKASGRSKGFFTQDRINLTIEYLSLKKEQETVDDGSDRAMTIRNILTQKFKGKTMDQFRLGGKDNKKLYRLKKTVRVGHLGGIHAIDLSILDNDKFEEVIAIDDGLTFSRINNIHWCSSNPLNHISSQQLPNRVADKYGLNIPNNISFLLIKVCQLANKAKKRKSTCGPLIVTAINISKCASNLVGIGVVSDYYPTLLICDFTNKQYFDIIPMQTPDFAEVAFHLLRMFNAYGYPSSVRYFEHVDAPVVFQLGKNQNCVPLSVDDFEKRLLNWIVTSQSPRDDVGVSMLSTPRRRSAILDMVGEFLVILIKQYLRKKMFHNISLYGWLPLIQTFLNEDETYASRKDRSFLASFDDAQVMYNEWESFARERLQLDDNSGNEKSNEGNDAEEKLESSQSTNEYKSDEESLE